MQLTQDVLDLHMNMSSNDLFIIDFNPFATITDSLLFDWPELLSTINNEMFELRLISGTEDNRLETRVANSENRVPLEMIEFSQTEKGMSDFIKLVKDEYLDQKKSIDS